MSDYGSSEDHQPVTWVRGHAIYAAHFVVLVLVASMLATTVLMAFSVGALWTWLPFDSARVLQGELWRAFTYGLVNPPGLWFAINMVMIVWFGRELEKHFGRRTFLLLYGCLYLLPPLIFTVIGLGRPIQFSGESSAFALFIAFATLYPNVAIFFSLLAKWVAAILVGIYSLVALSNRDLVGLISLWATVGFAYLFVRYEQGQLNLPKFNFARSDARSRVQSTSRSSKIGLKSSKNDSMAEVDALLDKIARSGLSSLTAKERAKLDAAREDLGKRNPN